MTKQTLIFLNESGLSGKIVARKGTVMSLAQRALAGVFATAMAVAPALAQDAKVAPAPVSAGQQTAQPNELRQAEKFSETFPGIVICIAKGQKDPITGEKIGDTLTGVIHKAGNVPLERIKYLVTPGSDYSAIAFFVKGHAYGPYGLKESLGGSALAVDNYNEKIHNGTFPPPDVSSGASDPANSVAARPEIHH